MAKKKLLVIPLTEEEHTSIKALADADDRSMTKWAKRRLFGPTRVEVIEEQRKVFESVMGFSEPPETFTKPAVSAVTTVAGLKQVYGLKTADEVEEVLVDGRRPCRCKLGHLRAVDRVKVRGEVCAGHERGCDWYDEFAGE